MAAHDTAALDRVPRKTLAMGSEALRKKFAESDDAMKRALGRAIERALQIAGMTKGEAAHEMGYGENQAPISRWIAGSETPQFCRLFAVPALRAPLVLALAELSTDIEVTQHIVIRRRA